MIAAGCLSSRAHPLCPDKLSAAQISGDCDEAAGCWLLVACGRRLAAPERMKVPGNGNSPLRRWSGRRAIATARRWQNLDQITYHQERALKSGSSASLIYSDPSIGKLRRLKPLKY